MTELIERIQNAAHSFPDRIAYCAGRRQITYRELWQTAESCAQYLKGLPSPLIVYGHKEPHMVLSILSCILAGKTYVPVDCSTPDTRLNSVIEQTKARFILTERSVPCAKAACIRLKDLADIASVQRETRRDDIVYIIFTSGSTGTPKGVPISYGNLNSFVNWICGLEPLCGYRNIRVLNQASFSFDLSAADLFYSLCCGHTLTAYEGDAMSGTETLPEILPGITAAVMTPTFMKLCLLDPDFKAEKYPLLSCIYFCGEILDVKTVRRLFERFPDLTVLNAYGPTEAASAVCAVRITKETAMTMDPLPVGETASAATDIEIIGDEIVLKGKSVFGGYLSGIPGGWYKENGINCYRTGDIGKIESGLLYCLGRKDRQVKYKGYRIELDEIEAVIRSLDGISDCAVIAKRNTDGSVRSIQAFVTAASEADPAEIRTELMHILPSYMIPRTIRTVSALPVNANGKTDRKALEQL